MDAKTLSKAMGGSLSLSRYKELLPHLERAMRAANINTPNRAAMFLAQVGHESNGLRWMEELSSGAQYQGRKDLGNTQPGDGKRFKGSGPIQLTGRYNFTRFSAWCYAKKYVDHKSTFVRSPHLVRENPKWGFLAASWYWTIERPNLNALSDVKSLEGATRAINGGLNGLADRRARYYRCVKLGSAIMPGKASKAREKSDRSTWLKKRIAEHGEFSPGTIKRMQAEVNVAIDGVAGPNTWAGIQKWCGASQDGIRGPQTVKAMQKKIGISQSGNWTKFLVKKLQGWLNDNRR